MPTCSPPLAHSPDGHAHLQGCFCSKEGVLVGTARRHPLRERSSHVYLCELVDGAL
jgi:hypothetical protein